MTTMLFHMPRDLFVACVMVHATVLRVSLVTEILAIGSPQTDLVGKSIMRFNVPMRRMVKSMMRVVMTVRFVVSRNQKLSVVVPQLNLSIKCLGNERSVSYR